MTYIYVIPHNCANERSLVRFVEAIKSENAKGSDRGTAKIIRTGATKKTVRQWKRIDHVMLFAHGDGVIENLSDLAHLQIDEGYEQLYKASDQPHGEYAWKALSVREVDYYKELLEEWEASPEDDEKEQPQLSPELKFIGGAAEGNKWEEHNVHGLEYVYNTLYRSMHGPNARVMDRIDNILNVMGASIRQGCHWLDLGLFGQEEFIDQAYESLAPDERAAYSAAILPADIPIIQMRCMRYNKNRSAVLLGWGFPGSDVPRVFLSEDAGTVAYFKSYFDAIYAKSRKLYEGGRRLNPPGGTVQTLAVRSRAAGPKSAQ
jgi:hypothetical protein